MNISSIGVQTISTTSGTPQQPPPPAPASSSSDRDEPASQQRAQPAPGTGQQVDKTV